jgi:hypothetical protein
LLREEVHAVAVDLGNERRALLLVVGNEVAQRRRIEDRARELVRAGLACFLQDRDAERRAPILLQLRQPQRRRKTRRTAANDQDVDVEAFALQLALLQLGDDRGRNFE